MLFFFISIQLIAFGVFGWVTREGGDISFDHFADLSSSSVIMLMKSRFKGPHSLSFFSICIIFYIIFFSLPFFNFPSFHHFHFSFIWSGFYCLFCFDYWYCAEISLCIRLLLVNIISSIETGWVCTHNAILIKIFMIFSVFYKIAPYPIWSNCILVECTVYLFGVWVRNHNQFYLFACVTWYIMDVCRRAI